MRLWHYKLIPYLPKSQLVAQWRELNSIFTKQDNHILINYVYDYDKFVLKHYTRIVLKEIDRRGYKIKKWDNYIDYFKGVSDCDVNFKEHDTEYLTICYYNLKEKYLRGQKDFSENEFINLDVFYMLYREN